MEKIKNIKDNISITIDDTIDDTSDNIKPKTLYNVINITDQIQVPGWTLYLSKGQILVGDIGIATAAEVNTLTGYIKVVD